jgi:glycine hydroxymethyltransferase
MGKAEMERLAGFIDEVVKSPGDETLLARIAREVAEVCTGFPAPGIRV